MITALNIGINGFLMGLVYAVMALGLSVVFGVTRIVNFAHGEMLILAALLAITVYHHFHIHPLVLMPVLSILMFVAGYLLQHHCIAPLLKGPEHSQFIALTAIAMIVLSGQLLIFGSDVQSVLTPSSLESFTWGPFLIDRIRVLTAAVALITAALLFVFFYYTHTGKAIRACAENRFAAKVIGLNDQRLYAISFGIGSAVLAVSGCLFSLLMDITPQAGPHLTLLSFVIVIIGGLNQMAGPLAGGILLGIAEAYTAFYGQSSYKSFVSFSLLILILLIRPQGLLSKRA